MCNQQIDKTVIVKVARADPLAPPRGRKSGCGADFGELTSPVVSIQLVTLCPDGADPFQAGSIHDENIIVTISVKVKNRYTCSCGFQNIVFSIDTPKSDNAIETIRLRRIHKNEGVMDIGSGQKSDEYRVQNYDSSIV